MNKQYRLISKILAIAISSLGIIVLIGWLLNISVLKSVIPSVVSMKVNTALCFIFSGFTLWILNEERLSSFKKIGSIIFPSIMILIGLLTFNEYLFEINYGIDEFLFKEETAAIATSHPGRMAPITAISFVLSGISLLLLYKNKAFQMFQLLSLLVFVLALLTLIGYAYAVNDFQGGIVSFTKMAIHTSIAFIFLSVGMLFSNSEKGIMYIFTNDGIAGITTRKLLPFIIFTPLILGWLRLIGQQAGYYSTEFGVALFTFITILIFVVVVFGISGTLLSIDKKRKEAEEQLNEYRHFFNINHDLCGIANMEGYFEFINANFTETLGYTEKEFCETPFIELIHPYDIPVAVQEYEKLKLGALVINFVNRYRKKDGSYIYLDWNATPNPVTQKLYCVARDITNRKKTEEQLLVANKELENYILQLAESEEKFRVVLDSAHIGAWDLNLVKDTAWRSLLHDQIFGYENLLPEWGYDIFIKHVIPEDRDYVEKRFEEAYSHGKFSLECRIKRVNDNTIRWISAEGLAYKNEEGELTKMMGIVIDITDRKNSEHELEFITAKLKEAQALAKMGNWDSNLVTNTDAWSDEAFKILGLDQNTTIPSPDTYFSCIHPNDLAFVKEKVNEVFTTLKGNTYDYRIKRKDGTIIHAFSQSNMDFDENNNPTRFFGTIQDITEIKNAEEKLIEINKELESFSYSISHDLRAPLRAINGYAQILNEDYGQRLDQEGMRILTTITSNATKMGTLIDDLLAFSRLGRKEMQKTEVDMNQLIKSVINETNKSIVYKAKINTTSLHNVKADYNLLHQVMFNLVSNAIKYSSKGENPIVTISSEDQNGEIIFSVNDNGVGFDMQYSDKLFGVFQRLHTDEEFEGTGVGLAIVQRIITKLGGKVWAEGIVDNGATFYFSL
ncbi:PAS domain-containing protein [Flavobacterium sp. 120]|uniref:PAS domain-containing protein n=1 Tax=Flavobacterium sp. 120 TaxID=2135626 RepID=UPI000EAB9009|nr:PAS domain-containing protein [Flavobacterium sp. 120]RKS13829.1 PAS domain S-box-containing protein [Flavobacterium sp. 120]